MPKRYFQNRTREVSLAVQSACVKAKYPDFDTRLVSGILKITGELHPRARSEAYTIQICYTIADGAHIWVLKPELIKNFLGEKIPHLYPGKRLCLYQSLYGEFRPYHLLTDTIIPWTALWLFHYENWHMTGNWEGGGEHPDPPAAQPDRRLLVM